METKITYIADDGEEFDSEEECLAYENAFKHVGGVIAFDEDKHVVFSAEEVATEAEYYYITNAEKARKTFAFIDDYYGTEVPTTFDDGDLFRFDYDRDKWVNVFNEFSRTGKLICDIADEIARRTSQKVLPDDAISILRDRIMHCPNVISMACSDRGCLNRDEY